MTDLNINGHDVTVNRKRGLEEFTVEIMLKDDKTEDDMVKTLRRGINAHLGPNDDGHVRSRSDITMEHIEECVSFVIAYYEMERDVEVTRIVGIEVVAKQAIRKTPYSEQKWNDD